ncbi:MAG: TolC family protein [Deltaproteobacteria bacterium]|nr:TolC family protein [Deltaproteobacteria bacterium]
MPPLKLPTTSIALALSFLCLTLLAGCSYWQKSIPSTLRPNIPSDWSTAQTEVLSISTELLDLIDDTKLQQLVGEALENNPNLRVTALRLNASGSLLKAQSSTLLPQIEAQFDKSRDNQNLHNTMNSHQLGFGIQWEIDLWNRLADGVEASKSSYFAEEYSYMYARDALATRVIQAWLELIAAQQAVKIEGELVEVLHHIETILIDRFKNGLATLDELSTARSRTAIAKADLSNQQAAGKIAIRKLEILLGRYPQGELLAPHDLPSIKNPRLNTPVSVLIKRPDIRAALAQLDAAIYRARAANKAQLPNLSISGQLFKEATNIGQLNSSSASWELLGSLFQPLYNGGRLRNMAQARHHEAQAQRMELHAVVLRAMEEVERLLHRQSSLTKQIHTLEVALNEEQKSGHYYKSRYQKGLGTLQSVLLAREQIMLIKLRLNSVKAQQLSRRIELALALGSGTNQSSQYGISRHEN